MSDGSAWTPRLDSTVDERLVAAEGHINFLANVLARVSAERDEAKAELEHMTAVGNVLNTKRRHP